jgi:hypothetical protein
MKGVKSKMFGCYWKSMLLSSLCYPDKIDITNKNHRNKMKYMKRYIESLQYVIGCKYCACFIKKVLLKKFPVDYSGRIQLMYSIYIWKDQVTKKLQKQDPQSCIKDSPSFDTVLKKYTKYYAKCDSKISRCI